jgi:hypothetical protein
MESKRTGFSFLFCRVSSREPVVHPAIQMRGRPSLENTLNPIRQAAQAVADVCPTGFESSLDQRRPTVHFLITPPITNSRI